MNAEELERMLRRLTQTIKNLDALVDRSADADADLLNLKELWQTLNRHRLAMEAAAEPTCPGALLRPYDVDELPDRIDAIATRLGEIERQARETREAYLAHVENVHKELSVFSDVWATGATAAGSPGGSIAPPGPVESR